MNIYGIKDSANLTVKYKAGTNKDKIFLYSNYATVSTNEWTSEQVYARSKNVNAIRWDYNRQSTLKVDMEIFDLKWIAMLFGTEFVSGSADILKREVLEISDNKATMTGTAKTGSLSVYVLDEDGLTNVKELTAGDSAGEDKYAIADKVITTSGVTGKIAVYYLEESKDAKTMTISADKFPENFVVVGDTMIRGTDGKDEFVQITYLNVKPKSNFTLTMDASNITTVSVEFDVLKDTASSDMATYTIYK
jgi:hypothetical protein